MVPRKSGFMTDTRARKWPKVLLVIAVIFLILVAGAYFALTSTAFLKGVVLPKVSNSMNADITVGDAKISPFSQVVLTDVSVKPRGHEPLFKAQRVVARYGLGQIIKGNILVHELTLDSPVITLVEDNRGSNLEKLSSDPEAKAEEKKDSETRLNI